LVFIRFVHFLHPRRAPGQRAIPFYADDLAFVATGAWRKSNFRTLARQIPMREVTLVERLADDETRGAEMPSCRSKRRPPMGRV